MKRIFAIALLFLVIGCNSGNDIPKGILEPEQMQHILWDMLQADGFVSYSMDTVMQKPAKRMELYGTVLTTHKISQEAFRKNMQYYESRPDLLKIVLDSLQQMASRDTATIVITPKNVITDSVKLDSAKVRPDTVKVRKLSIEKLKALKSGKLKPE